jgi:hypothetical protein
VRALKVACGALLLLAVVAAVAAAQTPVPTVAVTAGATAVTVDTPGPIAAGPTRFAFTQSGGPREFAANVVTLRAGVSVEELQQRLASGSPDSALGMVFLEAAVPLGGDGATRAVTFDVKANVTYAVLGLPEGEEASSFGFTTFTAGATASGAQEAAPDATIRMVDYGFRDAATLPRNGTIRVENAGAAFHFALTFPVRRGVGDRQVGRALRSGRDRAIGRIVAGPPVQVQGVISPGSANTNEVSFPRRGRYALVCFFGEHNRLGMYKVVRVR